MDTRLTSNRVNPSLATGTLIVLATIFIGSHFIPGEGFYLHLVRATAEAGMIGGLVDWFAVEALFRKPLRLPIPHTALLPRNQTKVANSLSQFVSEHFMSQSQLSNFITLWNPARRGAHWFANKENTRAICAELVGFIGKDDGTSVDGEDAKDEEVTDKARDTKKADYLIAKSLRIANDYSPSLLKMTPKVSKKIIAYSLDSALGKNISKSNAAALKTIAERDNKVSRAFQHSLGELVTYFEKDGTLARVSKELSTALSTGKQKTSSKVRDVLIENILVGIRRNPKLVVETLSTFLEVEARALLRDKTRLSDLNLKLEHEAQGILEVLRPHLEGYISDTVTDWDSEKLVSLIEEEASESLTYIRINGAILGSILGGILFTLTHALSS